MFVKFSHSLWMCLQKSFSELVASGRPFQVLSSDASMVAGFQIPQTLSRQIEVQRPMLRSCCMQHLTSGPSSLLPLDTTPKRPMLRATSNTRGARSPRHNIKHHVSATSKLNILNIENQYLQHKYMLKILIIIHRK
jgi:hypothetical protein